MKTIGIVCEGDRDFEMISLIIDRITGTENRYLSLQPERDALSMFGNGWKGVWKWCDDICPLTKSFFYDVTPSIDLLIVHMDGDVVRNEKEIHCYCKEVECDLRKEHPLKCGGGQLGTCPILLPCQKHDQNSNSYADFLLRFIGERLVPEDGLPVYITVPCDSMDSWIVAAYEGLTDCEDIKDPWTQIIARSPMYHDVRLVNRPKKAKRSYGQLIIKVCDEWEKVIDLCPQAGRLNEYISQSLVE